MSGYTKLFSSITDSTIWQAPDATRLVWITMLAIADQNGYVGASVPGLASRARVSLEDCIKALDLFRAPDEWSRTKDNDGKRIAEADGGWVLLNHAKYRATADAETRKERSRVAMANLRNERKTTSKNVNKPLTNVNNVNHGERQLVQAEAEAVKSTAHFMRFWSLYPRKIDRKKCEAIFNRLPMSEHQSLFAALESDKKSEQWTRDLGQYIPHPKTWLGNERWKDRGNIAVPSPVPTIDLAALGLK